MTRINVNINALRSVAENRSVAWGKETRTEHRTTEQRTSEQRTTEPVQTWGKNAGALIFAAVLIVCSVTVGCSSDKPKPVTSNNQIPAPQMQSPAVPVAAMQAESKPVPKKVVHKKPATVNYTDKSTGVTFEYPRRYAIETGNAATELLASNPIAMNFVQPGGVALAAVELPETGFANTDFSSAFFDVSVHKSLTADQCNEFAVPQPKASSATSAVAEQPKVEAAPVQTASTPATTGTTTGSTAATTKPAGGDASAAPASATPVATPSSVSATASPVQAQVEPQGAKLLIGDMELRATEAVSGEGTRQSDSKYFHVFQNGACYEFALNVTTVASEEGVTKHVDRDKVFSRLEQILATVKISPVAGPEATAEAPTTPAAETPAQ
jgi:hypothetical protein